MQTHIKATQLQCKPITNANKSRTQANHWCKPTAMQANNNANKSSIKTNHQCKPIINANQHQCKPITNANRPTTYDAYELKHTHSYIVLKAQGGVTKSLSSEVTSRQLQHQGCINMIIESSNSDYFYNINHITPLQTDHHCDPTRKAKQPFI